MSEDLKTRMSNLVDSVIKLRSLCTMPDEFLAFISHMELNPSDANIAKLEQFYNELANYLQARADNYRPTVPQTQPAQPAAQTEFCVKNTFVN